MQARSEHRSARIPAAALAALIVCALMRPGEARATCGDYVTMEPHAAASHSDSHEGPKPCNGPMCSKSRHPLPSTPAPALERSAPKSAFLAAGQDLIEFHNAICRIEDSPAKPIHRAADILRPPCL